MSEKVYLAGPDVFQPNAKVIGEEKKLICKQNGFIGMFPSDNSILMNKDLTILELTTAIYQKNIAFIQEADIVVANLNVFRGAEPDSGTSFEVGYAAALGKKLYAYMDEDLKMPDKVALHYGEVSQLDNGLIVDKDGLKIENFGNPVNLMLSVPCEIVYGSFEECIKKMKADMSMDEQVSRT